MRLLQTLGCRRAIEVGPGQVLAKLLQRMRLGIASETLEDAGALGSAGAHA
jgi:malonyl CoA-acyl carrier protein transacylase